MCRETLELIAKYLQQTKLYNPLNLFTTSISNCMPITDTHKERFVFKQ